MDNNALYYTATKISFGKDQTTAGPLNDILPK
jgi:hypothetical protein